MVRIGERAPTVGLKVWENGGDGRDGGPRGPFGETDLKRPAGPPFSQVSEFKSGTTPFANNLNTSLRAPTFLAQAGEVLEAPPPLPPGWEFLDLSRISPPFSNDKIKPPTSDLENEAAVKKFLQGFPISEVELTQLVHTLTQQELLITDDVQKLIRNLPTRVAVPPVEGGHEAILNTLQDYSRLDLAIQKERLYLYRLLNLNNVKVTEGNHLIVISPEAFALIVKRTQELEKIWYQSYQNVAASVLALDPTVTTENDFHQKARILFMTRSADVITRDPDAAVQEWLVRNGVKDKSKRGIVLEVQREFATWFKRTPLVISTDAASPPVTAAAPPPPPEPKGPRPPQKVYLLKKVKDKPEIMQVECSESDVAEGDTIKKHSYECRLDAQETKLDLFSLRENSAAPWSEWSYAMKTKGKDLLRQSRLKPDKYPYIYEGSREWVAVLKENVHTAPGVILLAYPTENELRQFVGERLFKMATSPKERPPEQPKYPLSLLKAEADPNVVKQEMCSVGDRSVPVEIAGNQLGQPHSCGDKGKLSVTLKIETKARQKIYSLGNDWRWTWLTTANNTTVDAERAYTLGKPSFKVESTQQIVEKLAKDFFPKAPEVHFLKAFYQDEEPIVDKFGEGTCSARNQDIQTATDGRTQTIAGRCDYEGRIYPLEFKRTIEIQDQRTDGGRQGSVTYTATPWTLQVTTPDGRVASHTPSKTMVTIIEERETLRFFDHKTIDERNGILKDENKIVAMGARRFVVGGHLLYLDKDWTRLSPPKTGTRRTEAASEADDLAARVSERDKNSENFHGGAIEFSFEAYPVWPIGERGWWNTFHLYGNFELGGAKGFRARGTAGIGLIDLRELAQVDWPVTVSARFPLLRAIYDDATEEGFITEDWGLFDAGFHGATFGLDVSLVKYSDEDQVGLRFHCNFENQHENNEETRRGTITTRIDITSCGIGVFYENLLPPRDLFE